MTPKRPDFPGKPVSPGGAPFYARISIQPERPKAEAKSDPSSGSQTTPQVNGAGGDFTAGKRHPFPVSYSFPPRTGDSRTKKRRLILKN